MKELVEIRNVTKLFPNEKKPALDQITASIPKGKIYGLAGPDGAGKTTLIRLIAGLLLPTEGEILVAGLNTKTDQDALAELISYMPQRFSLYEDLTVEQNLNLYAALRGVTGNEKEEQFKRLLHFTNLGPFTNRLAGNLSGGMKQKLGLACALIKRPKLLLLDEPSVGVDPISRRELWAMVQELKGEEISILWSTAYLDEAEKCDRALLLNDGKLLFNGEPADLAERVRGRTFLLTEIEGNRRQVLAKVLELDEVIDGTIQGKNLRIVTKVAHDPISLNPFGKCVPTPPRFEDGFMDILGGGPGGYSLLADHTPQVKLVSDAMVQADHLTKKFGSFTAADNVNFKIHSGEIFGLLGPNGAGKSTTFKMLCGLLKPTHGEAFVNGIDLLESSSQARGILGYMAQKFSLYGDLSLLQNLQFFAGIYNLKGEAKTRAIQDMIKIFEFGPYLDDNSQAIPLGFKQRLSLSCALMHHPDVLFLDEPTSGVDPITRREFWNHINGLVEKGVTILVTTHFMDEAEYCDRIALIYQSQIIHTGSPDELKAFASTKDHPSPTLEEAFIHLIEKYDEAKK